MTIPELIGEWEIGAISWGDACHEILATNLGADLDAVLGALPGERQAAFMDWLIGSFDNDAPGDAYVHVGVPLTGDRLVDTAHAWIRTFRTRAREASQTNGPLNE